MIKLPQVRITGPLVNGTFGELLQGYTYNQGSESYEHFLFSAPVCEKWSYATAVVPRSVGDDLAGRQLCRRMLAVIEERCGVTLDRWSFSINSNIEHGKGMSSSTADIYALGRLIQKLVSIDIPDEELRACARKIEYGDEVLAGRISLCEQRKHKLIESFSTNMELMIVGADIGLHVKTTDIHDKIEENMADAQSYMILRSRLLEALRTSDYSIVGDIATQSGKMFLRYNNYTMWSDMQAICEKYGGLGIILAHSGSVIGILVSKKQTSFNQRVECIMTGISRIGFRPAMFTIKE